MKKSLLFLSLFTALTMASCGESTDTSKIALDYGYDYKNDIVVIDELEIGYSSLVNMIDNKESFVLLIFHSRTCDCWRHFNPLAVQFMNKYNLRFYAFDNALLEGENNYGIYRGTDAMPGICFFRRGTLIRQSIYEKIDINHRKFFNDYDALESYMFDNIYLPKMYYLDKDNLEAKMADTTAEFNLYVAMNGCGDCKRVSYEYIYSWVDNNGANTLTKPFYVFDIAKYGSDDDIRDFCKLSEQTNPKFGYTYTKHGYVPTFQTWKNGEIIDMITVLNDFANKETDVVTSYFSAARIANSPMLSRMNYITYDGTTISTDLINPWGTVKQDEQVKWHMPAVQEFFKTYIK